MSVSEQINPSNSNTDGLPRQFNCLLWCSSMKSNDPRVEQFQSPVSDSPWDHWGRTQDYTVRVEILQSDSLWLVVKLVIKTKKDPANQNENWEHDPALYDEMSFEWIAQGRVHNKWMIQHFIVSTKRWEFFPRLLNQCGGCTFPGDQGPDLITLAWHDFAFIQEGHINWQSLPEDAAKTVALIVNNEYPMKIYAVIDIYPYTEIYQKKWYNPLMRRLRALQESGKSFKFIGYNVRAEQRFKLRNGPYSINSDGSQSEVLKGFIV